jgi:hypothetical protein
MRDGQKPRRGLKTEQSSFLARVCLRDGQEGLTADKGRQCTAVEDAESLHRGSGTDAKEKISRRSKGTGSARRQTETIDRDESWPADFTVADIYTRPLYRIVQPG